VSIIKRKIVVLVVFCFGILFSSCGCTSKITDTNIINNESNNISQVVEEIQPEKELSEIKANEAGKIMILMYHVIGASKESDWAQTAENFKRDLETLYEQGYSLISLNDYLDNNIQTPAGKTPIIMTFDDGSVGHFRYIIDEDGTKKIDSQCAVGILLEFEKSHLEFGHTATFYVNNDPPFGQGNYWKEKLQKLVALGFDVGNHTMTHAKLSKLTSDSVQKELAGLAKIVEETVPNYKVNSLALPYGLSPKEYNFALQGSYDGYSYENKAVLKVGARPALSPVVKGFDPTKLPRVQASTGELFKWLEYFKNNPDQRYISDGNPKTIAIPEENKELLDISKLQDKTIKYWVKVE